MTTTRDATAALPVFRSPLLSRFPGLISGMSTRQGATSRDANGFNLGFGIGDDDDRVLANISAFLARIGSTPETLASMQQVHGDRIVLAQIPGVYPDADAIVTGTRGMVLAVRVADCVPVLCHAPGHGIVAAIHAGWKGTALGISRQTIAFLVSVFGVEPPDIFCYIGPAAGACCYQVEEDVASRFRPDVVSRKDGVRPTVDLQKANLLDLIETGIPRENIELEPLCTIHHPALFHSHRRDRERSGRMLAVIGMRPDLGDEESS